MNINWKKQGYKIGQEVLLVRKCMFTNDSSFTTGIVAHAGTSILKVNCNPKMQLTFKGKTTCKGYLFGHTFELYKDEQEYLEKINKTTKRKELINKIKDRLEDLSDSQLESIFNISIEKGE